MITKHHCAVLLNKDSFECDNTCTPIQASCARRHSSWAVEGMFVTGKFRRLPDQMSPCFTVANVHVENECAKCRSVCIALPLLFRDLCLKLGAVVPTVDLHKGAARTSSWWHG